MKLLMNNRKLRDNTEKLKAKNENYKFKKYDVWTGIVPTHGITLITLVLTIIILLILAGVVINLSIGENGLFSKAKKAREDYMLAANREQQELANLDLDKLAGEQTNTWESEIVTAKNISNKTDKSKYYGATVTNYTCTNGAGVNAWKIFYADENNIYLIADDYIHYDYCPPSATQTLYKTSDYELDMSDVQLDYVGSDSIVNSKIQALNKQYFYYLNANNKTSTDFNIRAVAYMLDTNVWNVYSGETAEYSIGGPTLELFFKSYNQTHPEVDYKTKVEYDEDTQNIGYYISKDGGANWDTSYVEMIDTNDVKYKNLYTLTSSDKAENMWLSSPSAYDINALATVNFNGNVSYDDFRWRHWFSPTSLPKIRRPTRKSKRWNIYNKIENNN